MNILQSHRRERTDILRLCTFGMKFECHKIQNFRVYMNTIFLKITTYLKNKIQVLLILDVFKATQHKRCQSYSNINYF